MPSNTKPVGEQSKGEAEETSKSNPERGRQSDKSDPHRMPPDSIPNPLPGIDPQQTPGIDHPPAEWDQ